MKPAAATRWVRSLRLPKALVDPFRPLGQFWEDERTLDGSALPVLTVFLAGAECRFTCVFCDLWRHTLAGPTPVGAVPRQLGAALRTAKPFPDTAAVKLYNASNFFDSRAVPPAEDPAVADMLAPFVRVTVECHPRLVGGRCFEFAERLSGQLEVAMGLETIHAEALAQLNKRMTLDDFDRAAAMLRAAGVALRAFVLVSPPFIPPADAVDWAVRSAAYAIDRGATHVSLIPVRAGNGALEALAAKGAFAPPTLEQLEEALERTLELSGAVVTADLWEIDRLDDCPACSPARRERLASMNYTGRLEPRVRCGRCGTN